MSNDSLEPQKPVRTRGAGLSYFPIDDFPYIEHGPAETEVFRHANIVVFELHRFEMTGKVFILKRGDVWRIDVTVKKATDTEPAKTAFFYLGYNRPHGDPFPHTKHLDKLLRGGTYSNDRHGYLPTETLNVLMGFINQHNPHKLVPEECTKVIARAVPELPTTRHGSTAGFLDKRPNEHVIYERDQIRVSTILKVNANGEEVELQPGERVLIEEWHPSGASMYGLDFQRRFQGFAIAKGLTDDAFAAIMKFRIQRELEALDLGNPQYTKICNVVEALEALYPSI